MGTDKTELILAIDLGTSGPKVALVDVNGAVLGHEFEPTELVLLESGGAEQDPDDWWRAIVTATQRLHARQLASAERIIAVSCTTQWSGTVAVDGDGRHLARAIIWMDSRGAQAARELCGGGLQIEGYAAHKLWRWIKLTGGAPGHSGKDPIAHILYIKKQLPELYARTHKFLEPMDYLNLRLTGRCAASYASITLHWLTDNRDLGRVYYHPGLLRMAGVDRDKLPELLPVDSVLGGVTAQAAKELGLPRSAQVVMGSPDLHSALVGSGAVRDHEAHLYVGTSSWMTCHVPDKKTDLIHNMASLPSAIPKRYLVANEQETAGVCLTYFRDKIFFADDALETGEVPGDLYERLNHLIDDSPPGAHGLIFTPWLYGERTPVDDHTLRAGFYNMSLDTRRCDLVRAIFEGVALNTCWLHRYLERFTKTRLDRIHFIGGGAQSSQWCQIMADVLDRQICQMRNPIQVNARGAGLLAALALGKTSLDAIADNTPITQVYHPRPELRALYDERYAIFVDIYRHTKALYRRLNRAR